MWFGECHNWGDSSVFSGAGSKLGFWSSWALWLHLSRPEMSHVGTSRLHFVRQNVRTGSQLKHQKCLQLHQLQGNNGIFTNGTSFVYPYWYQCTAGPSAPNAVCTCIVHVYPPIVRCAPVTMNSMFHDCIELNCLCSRWLRDDWCLYRSWAPKAQYSKPINRMIISLSNMWQHACLLYSRH